MNTGGGVEIIIMWTNFPLFPSNASTLASSVDNLYFFITAVSVFFTLLIFVGCLVLAVKYRRRDPDEIPGPLKESLMIEIVWSVIPFFIVMVMFGWGAYVYYVNYAPPRQAMEMYVVGKQWMWKLQHPEGHREINELHIPVNRPVRLTMTTEDVLHSFYIPDFRVKKDVVPGQYANIWFQPTKVGKYHLFCAEYCGTQHSGMIGWVHVLEEADYEAWLAGVNRGETMAQAGERLFSRLGCASCHKEDDKGRCPTLKDVFGSTVNLQSGARVLADEAYIRESILKPQSKIVAGYTNTEMPTFQGQISEDGILQVISYIKTLSKNANQKPAVAAATKGGKQ